MLGEVLKNSATCAALLRNMRHARVMHVDCRDVPQQVCLVLGAYFVLVGIVWFVLLSIINDSSYQSFNTAIVGIFIVALGLGILGAAVLWSLREDELHHCPACDAPVSQWRFIGTHLPPDPGRDDPRKAHTRCIRCVRCSKPVIADPWPDAPKHRAYHERCWHAHCQEVCDSTTYAATWCTGSLTQDELAYTLAATIKNGSPVCASVCQCLSPYWACMLVVALVPVPPTPLDLRGSNDQRGAENRQCAAGAGSSKTLLIGAARGKHGSGGMSQAVFHASGR